MKAFYISIPASALCWHSLIPNLLVTQARHTRRLMNVLNKMNSHQNSAVLISFDEYLMLYSFQSKKRNTVNMTPC